MTSFAYLQHWRDTVRSCPMTRQPGRGGPPSNAELRRWLAEGAILVNGARLAPNDPAPTVVVSLVFFPASAQNRVTFEPLHATTIEERTQ